MRESDFNWAAHVQHYSNESAYFNKETLYGTLRLVNYFEKGFLNTGLTNKLRNYHYTSNTHIIANMYSNRNLKDLMPPTILRRIEVMADYLYDESSYTLRIEDNDGVHDSSFGNDRHNKNVNHEKNLKICTVCIAMQLAVYYAQMVVRIVNGKEADRYIKDIFYKIMVHYDACEVIDEIIIEGNKAYDTSMKAIKPEHKENEYAWDGEREYVLFRLMITRYINNNYNHDMIKTLSSAYQYRIGKVSLEMNKLKPNNIAYSIIKKTIFDINKLTLNLEVKNRMMDTLNNLFNESIFDEHKEEELLRAALVYQDSRRPTIKCEKLFEENKENYEYKGVVYHGFRSANGGGFIKDPGCLLKDYHDGFISCSKDLRIAASFSNIYDWDCEEYHNDRRAYGSYVLEILIDEKVEAIDIEKLLTDMNNKSPERYNGLYDSFIREKEVLLKLPMVSYNILTDVEVKAKLETMYGKKKEWKTWDDKNKEAIDSMTAPCVAKPLPINTSF